MSELEQPQIEDSEAQEDEKEVSATSAEDSEETQDETELDTEQTEESDEEETEYEGKKYKVPKELKDALLRQADYTRKTQEVAAEKRQVEQERQRFQAELQVHQQNQQEIGAITAIDQQLAQFGQVNWQALMDTDPVQAMKLDRQMRDMQAQRAQLANVITQRQQQFSHWQQQQAAAQMEEGQRVLQREIPGWNKELAGKLSEYGKARGYPEGFLSSVMSPQFVIDLYNSYQFSELRKKATTKPKQIQEKPVTRIAASKGAAVTDPDRMSSEQWLKWRNAQVKRR